MPRKKQKSRTPIMVVSIISVVVIIFVGAFFFIGSMKVDADDLMSVMRYDKDKNLISVDSGTMSIVGGVPNTKYISFILKAEHSMGSRSINNLQITDATPNAFYQSLPTTVYTLNPGQTVSWESELIDVQQYEGQTVTFYVEITGEDSFTDELIPNNGSITLKIEEETPVGFGVNIESSAGSAEMPTCEEGYELVDGDCVLSEVDEEPVIVPVEPSKTVMFRTNVDSENIYYTSFTSAEIVIDYDGDGNLECYNYYSYFKSYTGSTSNFLIKTPEGYNVYKYGAPADRKVIIHTSINPIFRPSTNCAVPLSTTPTEPYATNGQEIYS